MINSAQLCLSRCLWQTIAFIPPPSVCRIGSTKQNLPWLHICFDIFTRLTDSSLVTNVWSLLDVWKFPWIQLVLSKHAATAPLTALNKLPIAHICTSPFTPLSRCHRGIRLHLPPWPPPVSRNIISPGFPIKAVAKTHGYGKLVVSGFLEQDATWAQHTFVYCVLWEWGSHPWMWEARSHPRSFQRYRPHSSPIQPYQMTLSAILCHSFPHSPDTDPVPSSAVKPCLKSEDTGVEVCVRVCVIIRESKIIHRLWDKKKEKESWESETSHHCFVFVLTWISLLTNPYIKTNPV